MSSNISVERKMRARDVLSCFYNHLGNSNNIRDAISAVAKSPAPRFYISFERARNLISLLERGKQIPISNKNSIAQIEELYRRYKQRVEERSKRYKYLILEEIIKEQAPSFYLEEESICYYIYRRQRLLSKRNKNDKTATNFIFTVNDKQ